MKRIIGVQAMLTALLMLCTSPRGAQGAERTAHYEIAGTSAAELRESMNQRRPVGADGRRHDGLTSWKVRWRFHTASSESGCAVTAFEVSLDVVTTLPKWTNEAEGHSSLVRRWHGFYTALQAHEDGHKAIATAAAGAIRDAGLQALRRPTCEEVARAVNHVAQRILDQYLQKNRRYNAETDHGRTQGARFP